MTRVLLVEDEPEQAHAHSRLLHNAGFHVDLAADGHEALALLDGDARDLYDVIVSDIRLPGMDGVDLLKRVRCFNAEVPFIFTTGYPSWQSAAEGIELGIVAYLAKPVDHTALIAKVERASKLYSLARLQAQARALVSAEDSSAALQEEYDQAVGSMWMAYQPIISVSRERTYAYEALVRNNSETLRSPPDFLRAADQLQQSQSLGRHIRATVARDMQPLVADDAGPLFFVNINPGDLLDPILIQLGGEPLAARADRVVLEITERDSLSSVQNLPEILANLRAQGYRIAIDDLGQGHAGLNTFVQLDPDFVKLDMTLIQGIDTHHLRRPLVHSMLNLCRDLGIQVIAEGVETMAEHNTLIELGAELLQGYLYARPGAGFPLPTIPC